MRAFLHAHSPVGFAVLCGLALLILHPSPVFAGFKGSSCEATARAARNSCLLGASDEYWLNTGKCLNDADAAVAHDCMSEARSTLHDEQGECADQYDARLEVCDALGGDPYDPVIDPNNFTTVIDNPYFPLAPGTTYTYETHTADGLETDVMEVTHDTRVIGGVTCVEVHDVVSLDGEVTEDTLDWYAQDLAGNVWYFGENSRQLEDGLVVGIDGSWIGGVDGGRPGIAMQANPQAGDIYRQEFQLEEAEDMGEVLALDGTETVPYGSFTGLLVTRDFTPLEPDVDEHKYYAAGIGTILEIDLETGDRTELISVSH